MTEMEGSPELPALFIGRFQPFHKGHLFMIKSILDSHARIIIGIGSAQYSNTLRNPFTSNERLTMIDMALKEESIDSYEVIGIDDTNNHAIWVSHVESLVPDFAFVFSNDPVTLRLFREKNHKAREPPLHRREMYSGTEVRRRMMAGENWEELVPPVVADYIKKIEGVQRIREIHSKGSQSQ